MKKASRAIAKRLYKEAHGASIGSGAIALNEALCENLFALYVCVLNGIFAIIGKTNRHCYIKFKRNEECDHFNVKDINRNVLFQSDVPAHPSPSQWKF